MKLKLIITSVCFLLFLGLLKAGDPHYYHWDPVAWTSGAPVPVYNGFQYGNAEVFYTNSTGYFTRAYSGGYENISGFGITAVKTTVNSCFTYGDGQLYYVGSDSKVHRLYKSGSWGTPVVYNLATQARGDALLSIGSNTLFYTSTTGQICKLQYSGSWTCVNTGVSAKSNCTFAYGGSKLFFVDPTTGKAKCLNYISGSWVDGGIMNNSAPLPRGDAMVYGVSGDLYYVDVNGDITRLFWNGSIFDYETITLRDKCAGTTSGNMSNIVCDQGNIYYIGTDLIPTVLMKDACEWFEKPLTSSSVTMNYNFRLTFGGGNLYSIFGPSGSAQVNQMGTYIANESTYPYVYLKGKTFYNQGTPFYAKVVNYIVDVVTSDDVTFWIQPHSHYNQQQNYANSFSAMTAMINHFIEIKNLGFNTIRVIGIAAWPDPANSGGLSVRGGNTNMPGVTDYIPFTPSFETAYASMVKNLLDAANANGLKVILCTGQGEILTSTERPTYISHLSTLASNSWVNTNSGLLAYDLFNEPDGADVSGKSDVCSLTSNMYSAVRGGDPNHLITINPFIDALGWDPSILSCDFYSFHFYTADPTNYQDVKSGMYWAKQNIHDRPWIIGETGFAAEENPTGQDACLPAAYPPNGIYGDGNETQQQSYTVQTQDWARGGGASGYSWWQFHDVLWGDPSNFMGIYSYCDRAKPSAGEYNKDFLNQSSYPCNNLTKPSDNDYYRIPPSFYTSGYTYKVTGYVQDANSQLVKDAVIAGWQVTGPCPACLYGPEYATYSKGDGTFELWSLTPINDLAVSYLGKNVTHYYNPAYSSCGANNCASVSTITLTDFSPCSNLGYRSLTTTDQPKSSNDISLFPNPTDDAFSIQAAAIGDYIVRIYSLVGQLVKEDRFTGNVYNGSLNDLQSGIYFVKVEDKLSATSKTIKLVKQ